MPDRRWSPVHGADLIQVSRFETWLRRFLGVKASGLVRDIDPRVQLSVDPTGGLNFENRYWLGVRSIAFSGGQAAVVGQQGRCMLFNPATGRTLIVVEDLVITAGAATAGNEIAITATESALAVTPAGPRDSRQAIAFAAPVTGMGVIRLGAAAAHAGPVLALYSAPTVAQSIIGNRAPILITPGFGVVASGPVNTAVNFTFSWYERPIENSEVGAG